MISKKIRINDKWLNSANESELKKIIIATNDGQGDTNIWTLDGLIKILSKESEKVIMNSEALDSFYEDTNANMTSAAYFNGTEYQEIIWMGKN